MDRKLLILAPMKIESRSIRRGLRRSHWTQNVEIWTIGPKAQNLPTICPDSTAGVMLAGFAGGLNPALGMGNVILNGFPTDLRIDLPHIRGRIVTTDSIVSTAQEKARLFESTAADACEMEARIVSQHLEPMGIPFFHLRVIVDSAGEDLNPRLLGYVGANGRVRGGRVCAALMRRPSDIANLWRLNRMTRCAAAALEKAACAAVDALMLQRDPWMSFEKRVV